MVRGRADYGEKRVDITALVLEFINKSNLKEFTAPSIARELGIPESSARFALNKLYEMGYLKKKTKGRVSFYTKVIKSSTLYDYIQSSEDSKKKEFSNDRVTSTSLKSSSKIDELESAIDYATKLVRDQEDIISWELPEQRLLELFGEIRRVYRMLQPIRDDLRQILKELKVIEVNDILEDIKKEREEYEKVLKESIMFEFIFDLFEDKILTIIDPETKAIGSETFITTIEQQPSEIENRYLFVSSDDADASMSMEFIFHDIKFIGKVDLYGAAAIIWSGGVIDEMVEPSSLSSQCIAKRMVRESPRTRGLTKLSKDFLQVRLEQEMIERAITRILRGERKKIIVLRDGALHPTELHPADFYSKEKADIIKALIERTEGLEFKVRYDQCEAFGVIKRVERPVFTAIIAEICKREFNWNTEKANGLFDIPENVLMSFILEPGERTMVISRVPGGGLLWYVDKDEKSRRRISAKAWNMVKIRLGHNSTEYIELLKSWKIGMSYVKKWHGSQLSRLDFMIGKRDSNHALTRFNEYLPVIYSTIIEYEHSEVGRIQVPEPIRICHEKASNRVHEVASVIEERLGIIRYY